MKTAELKKMLRRMPERPIPANLRDRLIETIPNTLETECRPRPFFTRRLAYLAVAAVGLLVMLPFVVDRQNATYEPGSSFSLVASAMADVIKQLEKPEAFYLELNQRTRPNENFQYIDPKAPFTHIQIWMERPSDRFEKGRLRVEKPERRIVFNGTSTLFHSIEHKEAQIWEGGGIKKQYRQLADPSQWLQLHLPLVNAKASVDTLKVQGLSAVRLTLTEEGAELESGYQPVFFTEFDRKTVFIWEEDTNRLIDLERYVQYQGQEVLVAKLNTIEYHSRFGDAIFSHELSEGVHMMAYAEPDNTEYSTMSPEEVARTMFTAWQNEDWDTVRKFCHMEKIVTHMKNMPLARFKITGPKFKRNPIYPGYQVPYELVFKNGDVKKHALALRNDNKMKRYVWDGGL